MGLPIHPFRDEEYAQDLIAPSSMKHCVDLGYDDRRSLRREYNFILYSFREDSGFAEAVHHLSEGGVVTVRFLLEGDQKFSLRVLAFLLSRFESVKLEMPSSISAELMMTNARRLLEVHQQTYGLL